MAARASSTPSIIFCQLFSEPDAGSDLTSLAHVGRPGSTAAGVLERPEGVDVVRPVRRLGHLPGPHRTPTRRSARASRSSSSTCTPPGVDVRPLVQLTGEAEFNEVFLDDVFVPDDQVDRRDRRRLVRSPTRRSSHERGTNPRQLVIHCQLIEELLRLAAGQRRATTTTAPQQQLMEAYVEVRLFQLHNWRSISRLAKGLEPGPEGSSLKLYWSEMSKRLHEVVMTVLGPAAPLWFGADGNPGDGVWQRSWLYYQASSIWAGTNEIQRTIVGERVLGLPRP